MGVTRKPSPTPLSELALLQREINQLFERLAEYHGTDQPAAGEWFPPVDVFESKGRLVVVVEVPGLAAEALKVVFSEQQLVISGERHERRPGAGIAAFLCIERPQGRFRRVIPVESAVDLQNAEARLDGGLLTITLPRLKERRRRESVIRIQRESEP